MKKRYTDQQIAYALKEAEMGTPVTEVCRKMGISDATFYIRGRSLSALDLST
jgi:putative transposase